MKILHLNANSAGGAFVAANRLSEALNGLGVDSRHLVYSGAAGAGYGLWADNALKRWIATGKHAIEKLDFLRYERDSAVRFAFSHGLTGIDITKHAWFREADVVHLHWVNKGFLSLGGIEKIISSGKKVVWTCHDMWPFTGGCYHNRGCMNYRTGCGHCQYLKKPAADDLSARVFQQKEALWSAGQISFITPSSWLAKRAGESRLAHQLDINVIPNGIDTRAFSPLADSGVFPITGKNRVISFAAANLSNPFKGFNEFNTMLDVMKASGVANLEVLVIGENKAGVKFSEAYPVQFTGYISDPAKMAAFYRASDVYVTTSLEENLPTTIMESLACGTPVAAFRVGGIPEMIVHRETGVLAESGDAAGLAAEVKCLLELGGDEYHQIRTSARNFALNHYDAGVVAASHLKLYGY